MKTTGNTILITGGTSGIGLELARQLLALDNTILITGRSRARLEAAKSQLPKLHTFQSDVGDVQAIPALYAAVSAAFPTLNLLINNAGIGLKRNLNDSSLSLEELTREVQTNVMGPMWMIQQFLPLLKRQESAAIVNVSSGLAFVPMPFKPIYCATKAAVHSYTQSLRVQIEQTGVKVFELAPPATAGTEFNADTEAHAMNPKFMMDLSKMVRVAIRGIERDKREILPGASPMLRMMGRVAPGFTLLNEMAKGLGEKKAVGVLAR
jgi:uncharacterized oxidoreductase